MRFGSKAEIHRSAIPHLENPVRRRLAEMAADGFPIVGHECDSYGM
jgi:hypothetical protein